MKITAKKKVLLIATGGTIASKNTPNGLAPLITSEEIISYVPEIQEYCQIDTLQLFNIDSTNIYYTHWLAMAQCVEAHYNQYDAFVITHGTDTMAYTAAALSYLIQNNRKPVVITGSQKSLAAQESDARQNLSDAFIYASYDGACGVHILFDHKILLGTRSRKTRTKSFNAFQSIDFPEIGIIRNHKVIPYVTDVIHEEAPTFYHNLNPNIFVLRLIPGISPDILQYIEEHYDAVVIESFGVGGLPSYGNTRFEEAIHDFLARGKTIIMSTQVPHEGSDMAVYQVGYYMKERYDLIEAYSMTTEAIVTKLMWILGQTKEPDEIRRLFYQPIMHDIIV